MTNNAPERIWAQATANNNWDEPIATNIHVDHFVEYTRADLAVTVKQLEWESIYNLGTLEQAVTPIGTYTISDDEDKAFGTFVYFHLTPEGDSTRYGLEILESGPYEVEEAKAATQADYEKRILSALDLTPADATAALQAEKDAVWNEAIDAAMTVCAEWEETFEKRMSNGAAHGASECFRDVRKLKREVK